MLAPTTDWKLTDHHKTHLSVQCDNCCYTVPTTYQCLPPTIPDLSPLSPSPLGLGKRPSSDCSLQCADEYCSKSIIQSTTSFQHAITHRQSYMHSVSNWTMVKINNTALLTRTRMLQKPNKTHLQINKSKTKLILLILNWVTSTADHKNR